MGDEKTKEGFRRIRIVNDGSMSGVGTHIVDADTGEKIQNVRTIRFEHRAGEVPKCWLGIECLFPEVDITAEMRHELIDRLQVLQLQAGDTLVLHYPTVLSDESAKRLSASLTEALTLAGHPEVKAIVIEEGSQLSVIRKSIEGEKNE